MFELTLSQMVVLLLSAMVLLAVVPPLLDYLNDREKREWNKKNSSLHLRVLDKYTETANHDGKLERIFHIDLVYRLNKDIQFITLPVKYFEYDDICVDDIVKLRYVKNNGLSEYYPIITVVAMDLMEKKSKNCVRLCKNRRIGCDVREWLSEE